MRGLAICLLAFAGLSFSAPSEQHPILSSSESQGAATTWDLSREPNANSSSHLLFDTVKSFLKVWPNTRYRNGHNLVAGIIPTGTLLYHGTSVNEVPQGPEWTAVDPEHSYAFCRATDRSKDGCWHLTLAVTRPLKVLYFDGSSAAKMWGGSMDTQDIIAWGKISPNRTLDEWQRLVDLCTWAKDRDVHGFVRMEMDFEVMLCDFTKHLDVVSFAYLVNPGLPSRSPELTYRMLEAGKWHDQLPGEKRIRLDYTRFVSFYDTSLFPSLQQHRQGLERWDHRVNHITSSELDTLYHTLDTTLHGPWGVSKSGIDWPALLTVVEQRHNERLEILRYILFDLAAKPERELQDVLIQAHHHVNSMLAPYILYDVYTNAHESANRSQLQWAAPAFEECATIHTRFLHTPTVFSTLTQSERLILDATEDTIKEICRVLAKTWAEGVELGLSKKAQDIYLTAEDLQLFAEKWQTQVKGLMNWLDWAYWVKCEPACSYEETCYLPTWPFFKNRPWGPGPRSPGHKPHPRNSSSSVEPALSLDEGEQLPDPGPDDDWYHPSPRCIKRLHPFGM